MSAFDLANDQLNEPQFLATLARCADLAYSDDVAHVLGELSDLDPISASVIRWGPSSTQRVLSVWFDGAIFFFWPGLFEVKDYVDALLRSGQVSCKGIPGRISAMVSFSITDGLADLLADIDANCVGSGTATADVLFVGHSQGGANCLGFFALTTDLERARIGRSQIVSFQAPRCLDQTASGNLAVPHMRLSVSGDLVNHLPPSLWTRLYPPFLPPLGGIVTYLHHGLGIELTYRGKLQVIAPDGPSADAGAYVLSRGILSARIALALHSLSNFSAALRNVRGPIQGLKSRASREDGRSFFLGGSSMATFKIIYLFKHANYGWSEVHYGQANDLNAMKDFAASFAMVNARCGLLAFQNLTGVNNPILEAVRISDATNSRVGATFHLGNIGTFTALGPADIAFVAALGTITAKLPADPASLYKRSVYIRGIPDALVLLGGQYVVNAAFSAAYAAWITQLKLANMGMMGRWKGTPSVNIVEFVNGTGRITVETDTGHGFLTGDLVSIEGVEPKGIINGNFRVIFVDATHFQILGQQIVGTIEFNGFARKYEELFIPYDAGQIQRITRRDTGRPFDSPVGRQKTR